MGMPTPEEIDHHVHTYVKVFVGLLILTVLTVVVAEFHLSPIWAVAVALAIACTKGSMVAAYFMHLIWEKRIIFATLVLTVVFFFFLLLIPVATSGPPLEVISHGTH
jgi:caa(3)-type oxidase subunit IV